MPNLQETLKQLIARDLGVSPEDVTPDFVRRWTEDRKAGEPDLEFRSHYGGYHGSHLRHLTREQIQTNRDRAEEFLRPFSS